jgi:hypothetical protein
VNAPRRYDEWCAVIEALGTPMRDEEVRAAIADGVYPAGPGVTERITKRLHDAFDARIRVVHNALRRELSAVTGPHAVELALAHARSALRPLARLALCATFPDSVRGHLRSMLDEFVRARREALEESARTNGRQDGVLLAAIMRSRFAVPWDEAMTRPASVEPQPAQPRRILL